MLDPFDIGDPSAIRERFEALERRVEALERKKNPVKNGIDWLAELKADPLFQGIDFAEQERKIAIWKMKPENAHRQITKRFWLNWLAKVDTTVPVVKVQTPQPKAQVKIYSSPLSTDTRTKAYEPPPPEVMDLLSRIGKGM
jgi:hypothetical protein